MPDEVTIEIGGTGFGGWESLTITRSLDNVADGFSLQAPFDPDIESLRAAFRPFSYQLAAVKIDGELVLTGRVESVAPTTSAGDRAINVQGRSLTGALVDCAIDGVGFQFDGLTLAAIARRVAAPFGLAVVAEQDSAKIGEARATPGQGAFDFLNQLAQDAGLLLDKDAEGRLLIRKIQPGAAPVAALIEGASPVIDVAGSYDGTQRFSRYKVLQQQDGEPGIVGAVDDAGVPVYRPTVQAGAEGDAKAVTAAAEWRRALALAGSVGLTATVSGWRNPAGRLWMPGEAVTVLAPGAFILRETAFIIAEATLALDSSQGRTTALRLVLPATYSGQLPEVYPWA